MARALVSFSGLASWCCGAGAQLTAPTCSPWLLSKSLGWQSVVRAKTSQGQHRGALLRAQKYLCPVQRQTRCETSTRGSVERRVLAGAQIAGTGIWPYLGGGREGSGLNGAEACKVSEVSRGSGRSLMMVLGVDIGLPSLLPPPHESVPSHKRHGEGGERKGHGEWPCGTPVSLSLSSLVKSLPAPHPDPRHRAEAHPALQGGRCLLWEWLRQPIPIPSRRKDRKNTALVPKLWQPGPIMILQPPPLPVPELCTADLKVNRLFEIVF